MKATLASLLALACLALAACSHRAPPDEDELTAVDLGPAPADLTGGTLKGTRWRLLDMGPAAAEQPIVSSQQRPAFIEFDKVDQRLAGSTGCNRFFGRYRLIGDAGFTIGQVGMTRAACQGQLAEQERKIIKQIEQARFFGISNQKLTIASAGEQRLIFVPMAADMAMTFRCDQGRLLNTSLSALTGHLTLRLPDGSLEDLAPEPGAATTSYASGLYRLQISGDKALLDDLTQFQQLHCVKQN
ncbi:MAG TPA: META domain-containing protein [Terriglobia bacterium]|nr:META domain-containing protein [Terriglobia bacterium]